MENYLLKLCRILDLAIMVETVCLFKASMNIIDLFMAYICFYNYSLKFLYVHSKIFEGKYTALFRQFQFYVL